MTSSPADQPIKKTGIALIDESVHTSDDADIDDIEAVNRDFIVVKRGFLNIHYYYIPISKAEGWDGHVLWLKITEDEVKRSYERDARPDPTRYYVKDYPMYTRAYYPDLSMIPAKLATTPFSTIPPVSPISSDIPPLIYGCDLCNTSFDTEEELNIHVTLNH
jgi:hypothetical protein